MEWRAKENDICSEVMPDVKSGTVNSLRRNLLGLIREILGLTVFLAVVFTFFFGVTVQHGNDMYPAIRDGDVILYYRTHELINTEPCVYKSGGEVHTGRIAASAGTVISSTGDMQLTFDGVYLPISAADGIYERTYAAEGEILPAEVRPGYYFVLGDNRGSARDSRMLGQISKSGIRGRIIAVLRRRQI